MKAYKNNFHVSHWDVFEMFNKDASLFLVFSTSSPAVAVLVDFSILKNTRLLADTE